MDPCAAYSARTLFNNMKLIARALAWRHAHALVFAMREACLRVQHSMRAVRDVPGESPGRMRNFEARESVRVSLALKFADVAQQAERESSKLDATGSNPVVRTIFRCTFTLLTPVERTGILVDSRM